MKSFNLKNTLVAVTISIMMIPVAFAGVEEGMAAFKAGNYTQAIREFTPLARQGDREAQYNLGIVYSQAQGYAQDFSKALNWFTKAAEQGLAQAQYNLAIMYANGQGTKEDATQASNWFVMAASQKHAYSQFNLAVMYTNGNGVPLSLVVAYALFTVAATEPATNGLNVRATIVDSMTPKQIEAAQKLAKELSKSNDFAKAIADSLKEIK